MKFKPLSNPILIVSDNPLMTGGLSRMCRDLATLCCTLPEFRVGVLGRGLTQGRSLPFVLYDYPESHQWGEEWIMRVWNDFAGSEAGVIITLDDLSRRHWFTNPVGLSPDLTKFLGNGRSFQKWSYLPLDSTGPDGSTLSFAATDCARRYDRMLAASEWGRDVLRRSGVNADWLPHGIWVDKFHVPTGIEGIEEHDVNKVMVGCVMSNQSRKDFPVAFECFALLKKAYGNHFKAWVHTDKMIHYWNLYALAADYGVVDCLEVTSDLSDSNLCSRYAACTCTILPTGGEGFGYPIAESLSCGTACVTSDYAAGQELVDADCRVAPVTYRVDTAHNVMRAVLSGYGFAAAVQRQVELKEADPLLRSEYLASTVAHLDWNKLRHQWARWLREGLR